MMFRNNVNFVPSTTNRRLSSNPTSILAVNRSKDNLRLRDSPVFYLSHLFSLFPFNQRGLQLELNYFSLIFSLIVLVVFGMYSFLHVQKVRESEKSNMSILLYSSYAFVNFVFGIACIISPLLGRRSVISILWSFSKADSVILRLHPDFEFRQNIKQQYVKVCFTMGVTLLFMLTYVAASHENIFPSFMYLEFYILPVTWLIVFQLDYLLMNLHERFVFVNSQLEQLVKESEVAMANIEESGTATGGVVNFFHLNDLNFIHFTLYKISSAINNSYSVQLLIMIPRLIFFSVLPLHYNIVSVLVNDPKNNGDSQLWSHLFTLGYVILLISPVLYTVNVASATVNQTKKVHTLIHDLIDEDQEERIEYEVKQKQLKR